MKKITLLSIAWLCSISLSISHAIAAPATVTLVGSLQSEIGCTTDWQPECASSYLIKNGDEWAATFTIPAGTWEYKIALNDAWTENYGAGGIADGGNVLLRLLEEKSVTFVYNEITHIVTDNDAPGGGSDAQPISVTIAGDLQTELGCDNNWLAECITTQLVFDEVDNLWQKTFTIPVGDWSYKATMDGSWSENYGVNASSSGENILLSLAAEQDVKFYYSHKTKWITSNSNSVIATVVGDFQTALGCPGNWQPDCLRTWLQDPDGNGLYTFTTTNLPLGDYEAKVALDEAWDESIGDNGNNIPFSVTTENQKVVFTYDSINSQVYIGDEVIAGNLKTAKAYWLARNIIALNIDAEIAVNANAKLHFSDDAQLSTSPQGVSGGESITLTYDSNGLSETLQQKFRHLKDLSVFTIAENDLSKVPDILKQQIAVSITDTNGGLIDATALQIAGVLDDVFAFNGNLGATHTEQNIEVAVWAPTAQRVTLHVFDDAESQTVATAHPMTQDAETGVWSVVGDANWNRKYYLFEVDVFVRNTGKIEKNWVTDPYSLNTSVNGERSQFINLNDADLKPEGWDTFTKPVFTAPEDMVIYELHVRDFSISDATVPAEKRGTFAAFSELSSNGMKHLKALADAGLSHIHLLPVFDCATINEIKSEQLTSTDDLSVYPPDSEAQQAAVEVIRGQDGFNWCYDPHHYTVPDGSYATNPNDTTRIREFRSMVANLNAQGLRVIMDVVYNHTSGSLLGDTSVLDKIVPSYYHRLNPEGDIEKSTCCANTASENFMMEKLMRDSIKTWATAYKVDGFRYDIMGHHTKNNIVTIQNDIHALTLEDDGVDGPSIYFYGEGWNFGEVINDRLFTQARIGNMSGTGVGSFNNFIRDAVRGGGPFDSGIGHVQSQSFISGLFLDPNAENSASDAAKENLLKQTDMLKVVLAGSVQSFSLQDYNGTVKQASAIDGAGFTLDPQETINYIEAHDNETLFDMIHYKAPLTTSMTERVRIQNMGNSILLFAQGIPFLHAGQDMLRSKSTDRNSYDAGDWFNLLDFTYQQNGWGRGLPLQGENQQNWDVTKTLLAKPDLMPTSADIQRARDHTSELLKIRKSSPLFRLQTAEQINEHVTFYNNGPDQIPGLIAMGLTDSANNIDSNAEIVLVMFNTDITEKTLTIPELKDWNFALHDVQQNSTDAQVKLSSADNTTGEFTVPARTTAVFVATEKLEPETPDPVTPDKPDRGSSGAMNWWWLGMLLLLLSWHVCCKLQMTKRYLNRCS